MQDYSNSITIAMELLQSCTKSPKSTYGWVIMYSALKQIAIESELNWLAPRNFEIFHDNLDQFSRTILPLQRFNDFKYCFEIR